MNFDTLYDIQHVLDSRILEEHGLTVEETFAKKLLALQVELCELANETRCFKYWSHKGPAPKGKVLEEYVDALHFVLGLGLDLGYRDVPIPQTVHGHNVSVSEPASGHDMSVRQSFCGHDMSVPQSFCGHDLTLQFQTLLAHCVALSTPSRGAYATLFSELLALGWMLGFSEDEIENAYLEKNKKNHLRQNEGY